MAGRKFSTSDYFNARCADLQPLFAFNASTEAEAKQWRIRALAKVRDLLGEMPDPAQLEPEIIETIDMGAYIRQKIVFDADAHSSVPGYILIPRNLSNPSRALLCLHGHGPGKDAVVGITTPREGYDEEAMRRIIEQHNYDYAHQFAERGYITLTFDFRCFGERAHTSFDLYGRDRCNVHFIRGSSLGMNLLALNIADTIRAIDYLQTRPEVDPARIGCMGLSFGGTMTLWGAVIDKRIRAACISGYLCEWESFAIEKGNFCGSQMVPDLRRYFDLCDVASLIAPRPLLIESGILDDGFPIDSAKRAFARLKETYRVWDSTDHLAHDVHAGGHRFSGAKAFDWFDKWL